MLRRFWSRPNWMQDGKAVNPLMVAAYLSSNYVIQKAWTQTLEARTGGDADAFKADPAEDFISSGPYHKYFTNDTDRCPYSG